MFNRKNSRFIQCIFLILFTIAFVNNTFSQDTFGNATVVNGDVNVRETPPKFTTKTLYTFELSKGKWIDVLPPGTRVQILSKVIIAGTYEWFEVEYQKNGRKRGWIYAGEVNQRQYLRMDNNGVSLFNSDLSGGDSGTNVHSFINFTSMAYAQNSNEETDNDKVTVKTDPFKTLLISVCYLALFIVSLILIRRYVFPQSAPLTFLTSLSILLVLGFISNDQFSNILREFVTKPN